MRSAVLLVILPVLLAASACSICSIRGGDTPVSQKEMEGMREKELDRAGAGFEAFTKTPWVVVVDGGKSVRVEAEETIGWASVRLRNDFFAREPNEPITIYVFPDEDRYMRGSSAVLGITPTTPYGFYRVCSKTLVVNAGYGWGTLVHEMVHAYLAADFPDAPQWINEGLASLFEATAEDKEGHIRGDLNWRLPALQAALAKNGALSFHKVAHGSRGDFDGKEGYLYYAESRYLLYFLQERSLLRRFYGEYRANVGHDARGLATLEKVTGKPLSETRKEWEGFVAGLQWEPRIRR